MRNLRENFPHSNGNHTENASDPKPQRGQTEARNPTDDGAWKIHFSLGENVRFTRTPEVELMRRRGEDLPDVNARPQVQPVAEAQEAVVEKAAEVQPMAVAALQQSVSLGMVQPPVVPVPPALPVMPAAVAAPVVQAIPEPVVAQAPIAPATDITTSAFAYISDFAFWEGCDVEASVAPTVPLVAAAPAAPKKPAPTVESILAQFRIREWNSLNPL